MKKANLTLVYILSFFFVALITSIIIAKSFKSSNPSQIDMNENQAVLSRTDSLVTFAKSLMGTRYKFGSCTEGGFDCSGFVYYVFSKFHIKIPRSSYDVAEEGVLVSPAHAQKGDLIFFRGTDPKDRRVGHVGIIVSEKGEPIEFIHSSSNAKKNGVIITELNSSHYRERFVKIKRFL